MALSNALEELMFVLRTMRTFPPMPMVWFPLIQVRSSTKFCTGVSRARVRLKFNGEKTKRKLMALADESPC